MKLPGKSWGPLLLPSLVTASVAFWSSRGLLHRQGPKLDPGWIWSSTSLWLRLRPSRAHTVVGIVMGGLEPSRVPRDELVSSKKPWRAALPPLTPPEELLWFFDDEASFEGAGKCGQWPSLALR